jgi:hypothetical protein
MFFDPTTNSAFGSMGWVDGGAIWRWVAANGREDRIAVAGSSHLSVSRHGDRLLRVIAYGAVTTASIRSTLHPDKPLATLRPTSAGWRFEGDSALWGSELALRMVSAAGQNTLLLVNGQAETADALDLTWHNHSAYDMGYQGLVDCLAMPGVIVVSVQRSSDLVLIDPIANAKVGSIPLAGRHGNPRLARLSDSSFVASDYDVICVVDLAKNSVTASPELQAPAGDMTQQFIGDYEVGSDSTVVARPFSGDVVRLDPTTGAIIDQGRVAGQPLQVCMTSDRDFVTRDWKTGAVSAGAFQG